MREIVITHNEQGQRIDKFLLKYLNKAPKSFVYKMLRKKNIKLNDRKAAGSEIISQGDCVKLFLSEDTIESFRESKHIEKTSRDFDIIYEDENIIVCGKPSGLIVHPDNRHRDNTLNDQLLYYLKEKGEFDPDSAMGFVPSICNRLDLNTSGIVTMGKNLSALQELNRGFRERFIDKYYITLVKGVVDKEGIIEGYHSKEDNNIVSLSSIDNGGSYVCTKYRPIKTNGEYTLLEVKLETGRSHQIRVCMKALNHPIAGDRKYGDSNVNRLFYDKYKLTGQFLHSYKIVFNFNDGCLSYLKGQEFKADLSSKMSDIIYKNFTN